MTTERAVLNGTVIVSEAANGRLLVMLDGPDRAELRRLFRERWPQHWAATPRVGGVWSMPAHLQGPLREWMADLFGRGVDVRDRLPQRGEGR